MKANYNITLIKTGLLLVFLMAVKLLFSQEIIILSDKKKLPLSISKSISFLNDTRKEITAENIILQKNFTVSNKTSLTFSSQENNVWIKFKVKNLSNDSHWILSIDYADIPDILLYEKNTNNNLSLIENSGNLHAFKNRGDNDSYFNFQLNVPTNQEKEYYLNIISRHPFEVPLFISDASTTATTSFTANLFMGIYCGIFLSTILYNLFIFFATRDRNYLLYVLYLFTFCFAQLTLEGWTFKFFWPSLPGINSYMVIFSACLAGIFAIVFAKRFLQTSHYTPVLNRVLNFLNVFYFIAIGLSFTSYLWLSYTIFNFVGIPVSVILLYTSIIIYKKGNSSALFYLIAWSMLLLGFVVHLLLNLSILPTNQASHFILYIGSSIEAVLLSFALANKINILRNEKEKSQAEVVEALQENEQLIREQNIILETKIEERTHELQQVNSNLTITLTELKDAQIQLVESEKMASLGQLTAGIAHEINNPINFVKSNVRPLFQDVQELFELINRYQKLHNSAKGEEVSMLHDIRSFEKQIDPDFIKEEIESLIGGIEEGAERTAEIVRSLRNFSRLDESEIKVADVHEGIDSTLVLLKNMLPPYLKVIKNFNAKSEIECYPSKLNQVFMNMLTNSIQAIKSKPVKGDESITITTKERNEYLEISIKDTGTGMTEEVEQKIFDPCFTTKEVGEGTGLGMSIAFKIIEKHQGKISVFTSPGNGTEMILQLPYALSLAAITAEI